MLIVLQIKIDDKEVDEFKVKGQVQMRKTL